MRLLYIVVLVIVLLVLFFMVPLVRCSYKTESSLGIRVEDQCTLYERLITPRNVSF